jgi:hypothetical protein
MQPPRGNDATRLMVRGQVAAKMSNGQFADLVGVSRRTIVRWTRGSPYMTDAQWVKLVAAAHARDAAVAASMAAEMGESLVSLGIEPPPAPPPPVIDSQELMERVLYAAAAAAGLSPQAVKPAVVAALDRAASLGASLDDVRKAIAPAKLGR